MTPDEAVTQFLLHCGRERQLSGNTLSAYRQDGGEFVRRFANRDILSLSGDDMVGYATYLAVDRALAPATVRRRLACLKSMFGWLVRKAVIAVSPFAGAEIRVRIPDRLPRCLQSADMERLAAAAHAAGGIAGLATLLLFATGMRVGELASVRVGDVDLDRGMMRIVGKGNRERQVILPGGRAGQRIAEHVVARAGCGRDEPLLVTASGAPMTPIHLRAAVRGLAGGACLSRPVTPHMLRHTAATSLLEAGVDIRFVQRLLGHRSIITTQMYTHVSDVALKAAVMGADICGRLDRMRV